MTSRSRGFALLAVLWVIGMLALIAAQLQQAARSGIGVTNSLVLAARVQAATDAGARRAIFELVARTKAATPTGPPSTVTPRDGTPMVFSEAGARITVSLQDETGLVDLNMAPVEVLVGLFSHVGGGQGAPERLARAVVATRSAGATAEPPPGAPPPNPLRSILQLAALDGASPALTRLILPFVTVHGRSVGVDPATAPLAVLESLPGVDPAEAAAFVARRRVPREAALGAPTAAEPPPRNVGRYLSPGGGGAGGGAIRILARGDLDGARAERMAIVRLGGGPGWPYRLLVWSPEFPGGAAN